MEKAQDELNPSCGSNQRTFVSFQSAVNFLLIFLFSIWTSNCPDVLSVLSTSTECFGWVSQKQQRTQHPSVLLKAQTQVSYCSSRQAFVMKHAASGRNWGVCMVNKIAKYFPSSQWQNWVIVCFKLFTEEFKFANLLQQAAAFNNTQVLENSMLKWVITSELAVWN